MPISGVQTRTPPRAACCVQPVSGTGQAGSRHPESASGGGFCPELFSEVAGRALDDCWTAMDAPPDLPPSDLDPYSSCRGRVRRFVCCWCPHFPVSRSGMQSSTGSGVSRWRGRALGRGPEPIWLRPSTQFRTGQPTRPEPRSRLMNTKDILAENQSAIVRCGFFLSAPRIGSAQRDSSRRIRSWLKRSPSGEDHCSASMTLLTTIRHCVPSENRKGVSIIRSVLEHPRAIGRCV